MNVFGTTKLCSLLLATAMTVGGCAGGEEPEGPEGAEPESPEAPVGGDRADAVNPTTMGARFNLTANTVEFRVFSARATRIEVFVYTQTFGADEVARYPLTKNAQTNIWSVTVSRQELDALGVGTNIFYGYRAWGPNWPFHASWEPGKDFGFISDVDSQGNRFNPNKLLIDPYALEISHDPVNQNFTDGTVYATGPQYRGLDSGPYAPKSIAFIPAQVSVGQKPTRPFRDEVIYEVHVRGLTKNDPSIPAALRGTYKGAGLKAQELASLGITAIEFLPVHETVNDQNDVNPVSTDGDNYWGYMTVNFFAPDRRYSSDKSPGGPTREFREMVKAFHDAGVKVYIDVVFNHTAEGGTWSGSDSRTSTIYSFRGLDNVSYYTLTQDRQFYYDNTGIGHNYNTFNADAQKVIIDSLLYWRDHMGLDGYRFDLASVLGNTCEHGCFNYDKLNSGTALNRIWSLLSPRPANGGQGVDLIAEPWAIGGNSYQVGNFPSGWLEWNGAYRDTLRADQNQLGVENVTPGQLATRFAGSSDLYGDDGRRPWHSVNFIVAHDGMTLRDLYACNSKDNLQPWPKGPSDGGEDHNRSWDQGGNAADQRRAARNAIGFLMLSGGTPMITGGDEFLRTQFCNNNVYNLDAETNWLNYNWNDDQKEFRAFTKALMAFRKAHPALRPQNFYSASDNNGNIMEQLRWFTPSGAVANGAYFDNPNNHAIGWRLDGTEFGDTASAIYVAYNGWSGFVSFKLPWPGQGKNWYRVTDTCNWAESMTQVRAPGSEDFIGGENTNYDVCGRGLVLFLAK